MAEKLKWDEERGMNIEDIESLAENGAHKTTSGKKSQTKKIMRMKLTNYARYSFEDIKVTWIRYNK